MDSGAWWATVYGGTKRVRRDLSTTSHRHELLEGGDCVPSSLSPAASMEQTGALGE